MSQVQQRSSNKARKRLLEHSGDDESGKRLKTLLTHAERSALFVEAFEAAFGQAHVNVESFNKCIEVHLPQIVGEASSFDFTALEDGLKHVCSFWLSCVGKPTLIESDGSRRETNPTEAEHMQETFGAELLMQLNHTQHDLATGELVNKTEYKEYKLASIPVMIGSKLFPCDDPLVANYVKKLSGRGRKPRMPEVLDGSFVINGNFKNLSTQDRIKNNFCYVHPAKRQSPATLEVKPKGPGDKPGSNVSHCEYRSWSDSKLRSTSTLNFYVRKPKSETHDVQVLCALPFVKKVKPHVVGLFRYLGVLDNEKTVRLILGDRRCPEGDPVHDNPYFYQSVRRMILDSPYSCMTPLKIVREIAKGLHMTTAAQAQTHIFTRNNVDSDDEQDAHGNAMDEPEDPVDEDEDEPREQIMVDPRVSSVRHMFCSEFFPHVGTDNKPETCAKKIAMLAQTVRKLLFVSFGIDGYLPDQRDDDPHYETPGMLLAKQVRLFFRETLKKFQTGFSRKVNNTRVKDKKTGQMVQRDLFPLESFRCQTIIKGVGTGMATGKWGKHQGNSQNGVCQQLPRNNNMSAVSYLRRLNKAVPRESKDPYVRQFRNTNWGRICPADTTEGEGCCLTNPMAVFATVRLGYPAKNFMDLLRAIRVDPETGSELFQGGKGLSDFVLPLEAAEDKEDPDSLYWASYCEACLDPSDLLPESFYDRNQVCFFVNGYPVGFLEEALCPAFERALLKRRRRGNIPHDVTVDYEASKGPKSASSGQFNFDTENGCMLRMLGVSENLGLLPGIVSTYADDPAQMLMTLLSRGCFEFVSHREERYGTVALNPLDVLVAVRSGRPVPPRYEICMPAALFGYVAAITPFPEMNPTPRLIYVGAMSKQAIVYVSQNNVSTSSYSLWYPQRTIVATANERVFGFDPYCTNVVLSITSATGKEQEDPINLNRATVDRGGLRCTGYRRYSESRAVNSGTGETFEKPDPETCLGMKHGVYDFVDSDGAVSPGTILVRNTVLIAKTAHTTGDGHGDLPTKRDHSCLVKNTDIQDEDFGDTSNRASTRKRSEIDRIRMDRQKRLEQRLNKEEEAPGQPEGKHWSRTLGSEVPFGNCTRKANSPSSYGPKLVVDKTIKGGKTETDFFTVTTRSVRNPVIGDKFTSRHGQKGTCSTLSHPEDMPFCVGNESCNGITPDANMGCYGFPSRMTIAQLQEMAYGVIGAVEGRSVDATPFLFTKEGQLTDRAKQELKKIGFSVHGVRMIDGRSGRLMEDQVYVGIVSYLRLAHLSMNKRHARAKGPVTALARQPAEGRSKDGGLRFGEMEVACLVSHAATYFMLERMLHNSDAYLVPICTKCGMICVPHRAKSKVSADLPYLAAGRPYCLQCKSTDNIGKVEMPYAFKLLIQELQAMGVITCLFKDPEPTIVCKGIYDDARGTEPPSTEQIEAQLTSWAREMPVFKGLFDYCSSFD